MKKITRAYRLTLRIIPTRHGWRLSFVSKVTKVQTQRRVAA